MKNGVILYNLRDICKTYDDLDKTLGHLAEAGIKYIQVSGVEQFPLEEVGKLTEKYSLTVPVTHTSFQRMIDETDKVIEEHKKIGCRFIGIGSMPSEYGRNTVKGVDNFMKDMKTVAGKMKKAGEILCYHNHDFDLKKVEGGSCNLDRFLENFDDDELWFIPDIAWIKIGGEDPVSRLEKMNGRVSVVHFKDYDDKADTSGGRKFTELGKGCVDIESAYRTCEKLGFEYAINEQDNNWAVDPLTSSIESFKVLNMLDEKING